MRSLFLDLLLPLHTNKHHWVQKHWPFQIFTENGFVHISVQKIGGIFQTLRALLFTQDLFQRSWLVRGPKGFSSRGLI